MQKTVSKRATIIFTAAARTAFFLLSISLLATTVGCGSGGTTTEWEPQDEDYIRVCISEAPSGSSNPAKRTALFSASAIPDDAWWKKVVRFSFVVDAVTVEGDTANAELIVEDHQGNEKGRVTWNLERTGKNWKISAAPLDSIP